MMAKGRTLFHSLSASCGENKDGCLRVGTELNDLHPPPSYLSLTFSRAMANLVAALNLSTMAAVSRPSRASSTARSKWPGSGVFCLLKSKSSNFPRVESKPGNSSGDVVVTRTSGSGSSGSCTIASAPDFFFLRNFLKKPMAPKIGIEAQQLKKASKGGIYLVFGPFNPCSTTTVTW